MNVGQLLVLRLTIITLCEIYLVRVFLFLNQVTFILNLS